MNILSNGYRFRRGTGSPFDAMPNPDMDIGSYGKGIPCHWCRRCQMSVETRSEAYNRHQVWGKKHWCKRCGAVTASAVYFQRGLQVSDGPTLLAAAKDWMHEKEQVR